MEHSSNTFKVVVKAIYQNFKPLRILEETSELVDSFRTRPQEPWHPKKKAKADPGNACFVSIFVRGVIGIRKETYDFTL